MSPWIFGLSFLKDSIGNWQSNKVQREHIEAASNQLRGDAGGAIDQFRSDTSPYRDPGYWGSASGMPTINWNGNTVHEGGGDQSGINIEDAFATRGPSAFDTYDSTFGNLIDQVRGQYGDALVDPNTLASNVGGMFSNADTDAYEASGLADVAAASDARSRARTDSMVGSSMARGRGLDEIGDMLDASNYQENVSRGGQASGVRAAAENMRNQTDLARSQAMGQAYGIGEQINNLTQRESAARTGDLGVTQARDATSARSFDINNQNADQEQMWKAFDDVMRNNQWEATGAYNAASGLSGSDLNAAMGAFSQISGQNAGWQNTWVPSLPYVSSYYQAAAANRPPKSSGFGVMFDGWGGNVGGCIDADAIIPTIRGDRRLCEIVPGDQVMSSDGRYYSVVGKDCGIVPEDRQEPMYMVTHGNDSLAATGDHVINGVPAAEWNGRKMVPYRVSGDLILSGNKPYIANGLVVQSNIGRAGLERWAEFLSEKNERDGNSMRVNGFVHDAENPGGGWAKLEN